MKRLIVAIAAVAMAYASQAAVVDWKLSANKDHNKWTAYVIAGTEVATSFATLDDIVNASAGSKKIAFDGTAYKAAADATSASFIRGATTSSGSADYYFVLVNEAQDQYKIGSGITHTALVYDPTAQDSSPGTVNTKFADAQFGDAKSFGAVPEPTSAMLLLLGVAGLALRRRRA